MQTNSIGMHIQRGLGHEAWTWTIGHTECAHAAWTWRCSMDMEMQHGHGDAAWTWICSVDMYMEMQHEHEHKHGHGHAA
jgi:hypothetical protein